MKSRRMLLLPAAVAVSCRPTRLAFDEYEGDDACRIACSKDHRHCRVNEPCQASGAREESWLHDSCNIPTAVEDVLLKKKMVVWYW